MNLMVVIYLFIKLSKMKSKFTLATIIVNYKSEERTITYVKEELLSKCSIPQLIIIVNNKATDESSEKMSNALDAPIIKNIAECTIHSKIYVIHNPENSGFAKGNNLGVDFITYHFSVEYLLFTNNDIRFIDSNVIEVLIGKLKSLPDVGIIGPKVVGLDGNCQSPLSYFPIYDRMVGIYWGRLFGYNVKRIDLNKAQEGYYYSVMGSFFIANYCDYINCGRMDDNTFLYAEEIILAERLKVIGKHIYYFPDVKLLHEHGATTSKNLRSVQGAIINLKSLLYYYKTYLHERPWNIIVVKIINYIFIYSQYYFRKIK